MFYLKQNDQAQLRSSFSRNKGEHFASTSSTCLVRLHRLAEVSSSVNCLWSQLLFNTQKLFMSHQVEETVRQQKTTELLILVKHTMIILVWDVLPGCTWLDARTCMELQSWFVPGDREYQMRIRQHGSNWLLGNVLSGWQLTVDKPTDRSAMKVSSVSPLLWLAITPHPALLDIFTASILSVTDPIWLTCWPMI